MAKQTSVNGSPTKGTDAIFDLMTWLEASMGFTVLEASDGTVYEADVPLNGNPLVTSADLTNNSAWFRIASSAGREWTFQRGTTNLLWRIKSSALDLFTGGAPGATQTPSATDEQILFGAGTDAAPTFGTLFPADGTYRWHLVGFDIGVGAVTKVFPWFAFATANGTGQPVTLLGCEAMSPGSYPELVGTRAVPTTGEPDPAIYLAGFNAGGTPFEYLDSSGSWSGTTIASNNPRGWFAMNGSNGQVESFVGMAGSAYMDNGASRRIMAPATATNGMGPNPLDDTDPGAPILMGRSAQNAAQVGPKGVCDSLRWKGVLRQYPDTVDIGGERFVYAEALLIPFENGATPGV
jgi:hypothetical protein